VKNDDFIAHHKNALQLLDKLETVKLEHVPRSGNKMADALTNLAATLAPRLEESITIPICGQWVITSPEDKDEEEVKRISVYEIDEKDWCRGTKQQSNGELHIFSVTRGPCNDALSLVSGCNT